MITEKDKAIFLQSFHSTWEKEINSLLEKNELIELRDLHFFFVKVGGEQISIPLRIYCQEPIEENLTDNEKFLLNCFFTRHHDGRVRQKRLIEILKSSDYTSTPFIVQLLGEYIIEILEEVKKNLNYSLLDNLIRFKKENPDYFKKTERRVLSYWNCYYRKDFPKKENYAGFQILNAIEEHEKKPGC